MTRLIADKDIRDELFRPLFGDPDFVVGTVCVADLPQYTLLTAPRDLSTPFTSDIIQKLRKRGISEVHISVTKSSNEILSMCVPGLPEPLGYAIAHALQKQGVGVMFEKCNLYSGRTVGWFAAE